MQLWASWTTGEIRPPLSAWLIKQQRFKQEMHGVYKTPAHSCAPGPEATSSIMMWKNLKVQFNVRMMDGRRTGNQRKEWLGVCRAAMMKYENSWEKKFLFTFSFFFSLNIHDMGIFRATSAWNAFIFRHSSGISWSDKNTKPWAFLSIQSTFWHLPCPQNVRKRSRKPLGTGWYRLIQIAGLVWHFRNRELLQQTGEPGRLKRLNCHQQMIFC